MATQQAPSACSAASSVPQAPSPQPTYLRILSHADWVEKIILHLKAEAIRAGVCDESSGARLVIALTEAVTNAIVHGNYELSSGLKEGEPKVFLQALEDRSADDSFAGRLVEIEAHYDPDKAVWEITDQGNGFDFEAALARLDSDDPEVIMASGRGLAIMKAFVDEVEWDRGGRRIRLTVRRDHQDERRGHARWRYTHTVRIRFGDQREQAIARDLSASGIAFVTEFPVEEGTPITVSLIEGVSPRDVTGKIVRCRHVAGTFHDVAVQFDRLHDDL